MEGTTIVSRVIQGHHEGPRRFRLSVGVNIGRFFLFPCSDLCRYTLRAVCVYICMYSISPVRPIIGFTWARGFAGAPEGVWLAI